MTSSPFHDLNLLTAVDAETYAASIDPIWTVGNKVHGGSMMSLCAAAARRRFLDDTGHADLSGLQPLAVGANYLAAPDPGEITLSTAVRKQGKQVSLVDVELKQGERVAVRASVTLGVPDVGEPLYSGDHPLAQIPVEPPADAVSVSPDHPMGQVMHVAKGCDLRVDGTSAHFLTGSKGEPEVRMWVRPRAGDESDPDTAALFAIMTGDISSPVTMNRGLFGWAPTVQLTTYLRRQPAPGWLRVMANSTVLGGTWFEEDHTVLDSTGAIVVQSRQLAMIPR
ncbi:thioesterase family protein [Rhodococcus sp. NPDC049939]|uniref:thioesterase family protein n=1 Tax=Rhodococcus sp. NPDC049939 TaxID=3155511 RepID=UPI00340460B8